ncbi:SCP2 sterol-binding domain-containing protein [Nonomuraea sp. NPDC055795]
MMARSFDPAKAGGFQGTLEFRLEPAATWTITVRGERARMAQGRAADPALVLAMPAADLLRVLAGTVNPADLLMSGRLRVEGDVTLASRVAEMFGGPSPY